MIKVFKAKMITLLGYCNSKSLAIVDFDDPPFQPFLNAAATYYAETWSYELFDSYFQRDLENHIINRKDDNYLLNLIEEIADFLKLNVQDVFIIIPLKGSYIDKSVSIGNLSIIRTITDGDALTPPSLPTIQIIKEINQITGIESVRLAHAFRSIMHSRASGFLRCPLLILQKNGQYLEIATPDYVRYLMKYYNIFLRLVATFNNAKPNSHFTWVKAEHYFCIGSRDNYNHYPLSI